MFFFCVELNLGICQRSFQVIEMQSIDLIYEFYQYKLTKSCVSGELYKNLE